MSLLSPAQYDQFRSAIKQVTDTFNRVPVTFVDRTRKLSAFNQNRESTHSQENIVVNALTVYGADGQDAMNLIKEAGSFNLTQGYLLFNYQDLKDANLLNVEGLPKIESAADTCNFYGKDYEIMGIVPVGPLDGEFALVKLHFKTQGHHG